MDLASLLAIFAGAAVAVFGSGWFLLREISSQLRALRRGLEEKMDSKIQQLGDRMDGRMQKLEDRMGGRMQKLEDRMGGRMQRLEDGLAAMGRRIARLRGLSDGLRQPLREEPEVA